MTTSAAVSHVMLVEDPGRESQPAPRFRRYRLARLQINPPIAALTRAERFAHLKRIHD